MILFVQHHKDVLAHRDKIVMRHWKTAAISCDQDKRFETVYLFSDAWSAGLRPGTFFAWFAPIRKTPSAGSETGVPR